MAVRLIRGARWFEDMIASSQDAILSKSLNGTILTWNGAAESLFGYAGREIIGQSVRKLIPPELSEEEGWILAQIAAGHRLDHYESIRVRHDGARLLVSLSISPVLDRAGRVVGAAKVIRPIASDAITLDQLRESDERYRSVFLHMTEEVHYWQLVRRADGTIRTWRLLDCNPATLRAWGKGLEEVRGRTSDEVFLGASDHFRPFIEAAFAQGTPLTFETYFPALRQQRRLTCVPLGERFLLTGSDITAQRRAEAQRKEASEFFERLFEFSPDGILLIREDGCIGRVNARARELFGAAGDELAGIAVEALIPERLRKDHAALRKRYLVEPRVRPMSRRVSLMALRLDGTEFPVQIMLGPVDTADGKMTLAVVRPVGEALHGRFSL